MYKIIKAEKLNEIVYLMVVEAPMCSKTLSARSVYHCKRWTMQESVFL